MGKAKADFVYPHHTTPDCGRHCSASKTARSPPGAEHWDQTSHLSCCTWKGLNRSLDHASRRQTLIRGTTEMCRPKSMSHVNHSKLYVLHTADTPYARDRHPDTALYYRLCLISFCCRRSSCTNGSQCHRNASCQQPGRVIKASNSTHDTQRWLLHIAHGRSTQ